MSYRWYVRGAESYSSALEISIGTKGRSFLHCQAESELKAATLPLLTFDDYGSSHRCHESGANSQAHARAAMFSGHGTVSLREWLEDVLSPVRRNADTAVFHEKVQPSDGGSALCPTQPKRKSQRKSQASAVPL